jgi:hypothetical protein
MPEFLGNRSSPAEPPRLELSLLDLLGQLEPGNRYHRGRIVRSESREVPLEGSEDLHPFISDGLIIPVLREAAGPPYS